MAPNSNSEKVLLHDLTNNVQKIKKLKKNFLTSPGGPEWFYIERIRKKRRKLNFSVFLALFGHFLAHSEIPVQGCLILYKI